MVGLKALLWGMLLLMKTSLSLNATVHDLMNLLRCKHSLKKHKNALWPALSFTFNEFDGRFVVKKLTVVNYFDKTSVVRFSLFI